MEPCCQVKFNNRRDAVILEMKKEINLYKLVNTESEVFPSGKIGKCMKIIWDLMEKPETSSAAKILNFISIAMIVLSTAGMCLNTIAIVAGTLTNS